MCRGSRNFFEPGRNSLNVFCVASVLSLVGQIIRYRYAGSVIVDTVVVTHRHETRWQYAMEPSGSGTVLTESFQFLWCSLRNRATEMFLPRGRQVNRGIDETLRRIKHAAEALHAADSS